MPHPRTYKSGLFARFARDEDGSILAIVGVTLAVMMGFLALTFDFGRLSTTQSELQSFVDNVALAVAGELDGGSDALSRAQTAANQLISDSQTFGTGDTLLSGGTDFALTYFETNPAADPNATATNSPEDAAFVRVRSTGETIDLGFAAAFSALSNTPGLRNDVGAEAVAGFSLSACDITPLMFCTPNSTWKADDHKGTSVLLKTGGNGAGWGPGAFGYIDPSGSQLDLNSSCGTLSGAKLDACLIAATRERSACFETNGVDIRTGQSVGGFEAALNIRFDVFLASVKSFRNDPLYAPAPNVIKGYIATQGQCLANNATLSPDTVGLPPDDCHASSGCDRFGNGNWSAGRQNYINVNYNGNDPHPGAATRYDYYKAEIAAAGGGGNNKPILKNKSETGRPQCSPFQSTNANRRVLVAAAIDCNSHSLNGNGGDGIPVQEFVEIFMISPIGLDGTRDFWVEVVGRVGGGQGGTGASAVYRDVVRLYR